MARIAFGAREIGAVLDDRQTFFLRPARSSFRRLQPGDQLWLAEPFYLEARFNDRSPTAARDLGGKPAFAADHGLAPPGYGQRHPARSLCRDWHRFHLRILSAVPMRLQDITDRDLAAMGFGSRVRFAEHWDLESSMSGSRCQHWRDNPEVLRFGFELIRSPLPAEAKAPTALGEKKGANRQLPPRDAVRLGPAPNLVDGAQEFARRFEQPRRLSATAKNPISLPARQVRRVVAAPPAPAPALNATEETPVPAFSSPLLPDPSFTTAQGDKGFLAALKRERPAGHDAAIKAPAQLRRRQAMAPTIALTGTCPRCGTRLAYGCEHYPAAPLEAAE
jgi:hypothetical protein